MHGDGSLLSILMFLDTVFEAFPDSVFFLKLVLGLFFFFCSHLRLGIHKYFDMVLVCFFCFKEFC